jgi:predicted nucleotidyltransferase
VETLRHAGFWVRGTSKPCLAVKDEFGSHARGDADGESDIDVAIVSPDLGRDRFEEGVR